MRLSKLSQGLYLIFASSQFFHTVNEVPYGSCPQLLLLLLSRFSHVRLAATLQTAAPQAPLSLGFSRQEHWSGLLFSSSVHERESESEVTQSCSTLSDPIDCSPPGSSVHGIFQARVFKWGAIAFSAYPQKFAQTSKFLSGRNQLQYGSQIILRRNISKIIFSKQ